MKIAPLVATAVVAFSAPAWANEAALQLSQKNNCAACHTPDRKLVGPSWAEIAKKYAGDPAAEAQLVAKVKKGSSGVWGPVPMPPNVTVKDGDIKTIVQYVLSVK